MTVARVCGMLSANQGMGGLAMGAITRRLSEFVAATAYEGLADGVRERAKPLDSARVGTAVLRGGPRPAP